MLIHKADVIAGKIELTVGQSYYNGQTPILMSLVTVSL